MVWPAFSVQYRITTGSNACFTMRDLVLAVRTCQDPKRWYVVKFARGIMRPGQAGPSMLWDGCVGRPMTDWVRRMFLL